MSIPTTVDCSSDPVPDGLLGLLSKEGLLVVAIRTALQWLARLESESHGSVHSGILEQLDHSKTVSAPSIYDDASRTLSIVIPAYEEAARLPPTLQECLQYLSHRRNKEGRLFTSEIIVVDDGSKDSTSRVVLDFVQKYGLDSVRLLRLPVNKGKGYAVKAGVRIARGQNILFMDADGATKVSDVEKLEAELQRISSGSRSEALGMVVGSRAHLEKEAIAKRHWFRNFLMRGFHLLVLMVAGGAIRDTQCGFKLFSRRAARILYSNQRLQRWCFDVELLYLAQQCGIPVREVAVTWTEIPGSKIKVTSMIHMSWELLAVQLGYAVTRIWQVDSQGSPSRKKIQ